MRQTFCDDFEPISLGDYVRKKRLEMGQTQKEVANQIGVVPWTILNWGKSHSEPPVAAMLAIFRLLGYDPFPPPLSIPERLLAERRVLGRMIKKAAESIVHLCVRHRMTNYCTHDVTGTCLLIQINFNNNFKNYDTSVRRRGMFFHIVIQPLETVMPISEHQINCWKFSHA